jgi:magnesium chelatase family protein
VRSVKGALPIALRAKAEGKIGLLVPKDNAAEAAVVNGLQSSPFKICAKRWVFSKAK